MPAKHDPDIEDAVVEYAKVAQERFLARLHDQDAFEARLRAGMRFGGPDDPHEQNKIELTRSLGLFSYELFQAMICGGESYKPLLVSIMWDRLVDAGVLLHSVPATRGSVPFATHQINQRKLYEHLQHGTFLNLFASASRLPETYAGAVVAIDVLKGGERWRGTGFIVLQDDEQHLLTCRHNVDPDEGIAIESITSRSGAAPQIGKFALSDRYDIGVARLNTPIATACFSLSDRVEVFDEVFTLGFPRVPRAEPLLLGHRGEMNGRANLYVEKCPVLIISNLVSPGNSGGPVLTRDGYCVGMTINWLEGEHLEGDKIERMRFAAALPAQVLRQAIVEFA